MIRKRRWHSVTGESVVLILLLVLHTVLVAWVAGRHSPVVDEVGHLAAGLSHWKSGQFTLYKVNPPLVRLVASVPVLFARPKLEWGSYFSDPIARPEFLIGGEFFEINGYRSFQFLTWARWACMPFTLLGAYLCYRWARDLYGSLAGLLACALWCTSPNILGHAQLITPDLGATAVGLGASYAFSGWLKSSSWRRAILAGTVLGLALLTKFTWLILFPVWLALWAGIRLADRTRSRREIGRQSAQLTFLFAIGVYVINVGYAFEGSGRRLGDYRFVSSALSGEAGPRVSEDQTANRFAGSLWSYLPVPLPKDYLLGIDRQKLDFERKWWSYLGGEWRAGGWWYYYLYALAIKVPLGTWILVGLAAAVSMGFRYYRAHWQDEFQLVVPPIAVLVLVSSQTGFNHHLRYVLPVLPFAFIAISRLGLAFEAKRLRLMSLTSALLGWSVVSSLWIYPHSLSYFNEFVGGPRGGHNHLAHSNTDWGQDLLFLHEWLDRHPEARPISLALDAVVVDLRILGLERQLPPPGPDSVLGSQLGVILGPRPGWYAVSVNQLHSRSGEYEYFLKHKPVGMAGYSIYIYHVTAEEANRVRREFGMSELPGNWQPAGGGDDG